MEAQLRKWRAHGWRISGQSPRLSLDVVVQSTVQNPKNPVSAIRVGGRRILPGVVSSHAHVLGRARTNGADVVGSRAIAPGARVRVGRGPTQEFVGIAAVLLVSGNPALLTCGHPDAFGLSGEILAGDEPDGEAIAELDQNFLSDASPLDAAVCPLTPFGTELLSSSGSAPTFKFKKVKTPGPEDNGKATVFYQTHDGEDDAPTASVLSYSADSSALFPPGGPRHGFIETGHAVVPGDSGSLLSIGASLYGLCSGFVGHTAFFTPISAVMARLAQGGKQCSLYSPPAP